MKITHPEGAKLQSDLARAEWIAGRLLPWGREVGTRVCAIAPTGYEAYVRIFHHAEEYVGEEWVRRTWSEVADRTGRTMHPTVQFDRFGWPNDPERGGLDRKGAASLVAVLRRCTSAPNDCWMGIWSGYGYLSGGVRMLVLREPGLRGWLRWRRAQRRSHVDPPTGLTEAPTLKLPGRDYYLYRGPIDVVRRFEFRPGDLQTPNMWWPEDHAWFVASEIDLDSTIVGCSRECAKAVLGSDLEVLEVAPDDRLDIEGDNVNPER